MPSGDYSDRAFRLNDSYEEIDSFCCYVKPVWNDHITPHIRHLTGITEQDARHFDKYVLKALQDHADELKTLFNQTE